MHVEPQNYHFIHPIRVAPLTPVPREFDIVLGRVIACAPTDRVNSIPLNGF